VTTEAELVRTEHGLVPKGQGWFVLNARDAQWWEREGRGALCEFEGAGFEGALDFEQLGINLTVLGPGEPMAMYHWEGDQEDFLVLRGEAVLVIEGEERSLRAWDFVHCPAGTQHVIIGAGDEPCDPVQALGQVHVARMRIVAERVDDPDLEAGHQRQALRRQRLDVGRIGQSTEPEA
jgi:uncharacterized cupin superfamily protein